MLSRFELALLSSPSYSWGPWKNELPALISPV